ncbi:MAG: DegT/DnrJ/EryC1/StrS family aminotransferase, partial [Bacteroidales bacterium]|nr:DegT/DnrJ/EryC1/StrS family aminotransferase [Bacteroidales bacterium]
TANAISYTGAAPVFLDVDRDTLGLSPAAVRRWLEENAELREVGTRDKGQGKREKGPSSGLRTPAGRQGTLLRPSDSGGQARENLEFNKVAVNKKTGCRIAACLPMHSFGHPVKLDELKAVLDEYNIPMIEDAAESLGSFYKEQHTGTMGVSGILSFNGNKVITTGGGGMILTNDEPTARLAKHLTTQAKVPHAWEYRHDHIGYNYRLTNIAAALGCAQMETLDTMLQRKRALAGKYREFFTGSEYVFFSEPEDCRSNYWLNVILAQDRQHRDELLRYTNDHGVMTRPAWELMHTLPMFMDCRRDGLENSRWLVDRIVNIPSSAIEL